MARILIAGGSLGGLFAANVLLRKGHDVTVLEKVGVPLDARGAGITTHQGLMTALRAAGATVDETLGVHVENRIAFDPSGRPVAHYRYPQILTSWGRLYALLIEALPAERYRRGQAVEHIEQDDDGVHVVCSSGDRFEGDLLVASDGIRSAVRAQFAPQAQSVYAGYVAWRGVCDEHLLSDHTRGTLFENFGFGLPAGEQMLGYPVAGHGNATSRGNRRFNFVWYRPAAEGDELKRLMTDADGTHHPEGIAPTRVSWREIARVREAARSLLAPQFAEVLEKTALPFLQPIHDLISERLAFDRVALMGDAAFVARPHVGMGVTKAGHDARALADAIERHGATPAALRRYEAERLAPGKAIVERGRQLGAYMQAQVGGGGAGLEREAITVLRETAVDLPDHDPQPAMAA
jgi:2-polyprenyl-6-methoxyphenol hydroxylase-like FAD-dependent oxidoreductase